MLLQVALFLHILAAAFWIGGMLFLVLVLVPFLRTIPDPAKKLEIYDIVGRKFSMWGWVALGILVITGPMVLYYLHGIAPSDLLKPATYSGVFGMILGFKLMFVIIAIIISAVHDFYIGPAAVERVSWAGAARIIGRMNFFIAIIIIVLAVILRLS